MLLNVFCIYDRKAQVYANAFHFTHKGEAVRAFQDLSNNQQSIVCQHKEDFSLYRIGTYDDQTAKYVCLETPEYVISATDFEPGVSVSNEFKKN